VQSVKGVRGDIRVRTISPVAVFFHVDADAATLGLLESHQLYARARRAKQRRAKQRRAKGVSRGGVSVEESVSL
jgi:hypothetical protein